MLEVTMEIEEENVTVNWLMYKSYEFQRINAPDVELERWRKIYFHQEDYEKIYQELRKKESVHKDILVRT